VTPEPGADGENDRYDGAIVELTRLPSRFEADVLIAKLRSSGVRVIMSAGDVGGWYPHLGLTQGYGVLVAEDDLDAAKQLIASADRAAPVRRRRRRRSQPEESPPS
jgi:hypothetical protein